MIISAKEYRPSAHLEPYVDSYTYQVFSGLGHNEETPLQRCLPLGMTEIIIIVNKCKVHTLVDGIWEQMPDASFVGLYKDAAIWKAVGPAILFYITLNPESLLQLFKVPVATMFNDFTDIRNVMGKRVEELTERMYGVQCPETLIAVAEGFLTKRLRDVNMQRNYLDDAVGLIRSARGNMSIDELCRQLHVSDRKLQRGFKESFGITPKTYTRIIRFRNAYECIQNPRCAKPSWANLSYNYGYADQAHFIRDFKEFSGEVPSVIHKEEQLFYQHEEMFI
mgnify:CR=1 FL=1